MENLERSAFSLIHNSILYKKAEEIINESIGEPGFFAWIEMPNGEKINLPEGSKIRTINYAIATTEE